MNPLKYDDMNLDPSSVPTVLRPLCKIGAGVLAVAYPIMTIPVAILGSVYGEINEQSMQKNVQKTGKIISGTRIKESCDARVSYLGSLRSFDDRHPQKGLCVQYRPKEGIRR